MTNEEDDIDTVRPVDDDVAAHHLAADAVLAIEFGYRVRRVVLDRSTPREICGCSTPTGGTGTVETPGGLRYRPPELFEAWGKRGKKSEWLSQRFLDDALINLGGCAAEWEYECQMPDLDVVITGEAREKVRWALACRRALKGLSTSPDDISAAVGELFYEALGFVVERWPRIHRVATALLEKGTLTGAEIEELAAAEREWVQ